jgi:hypothetical protein
LPYQIPSCPPTDITAGDSIEFDWSLPEFPASQGWELSLSLRSESGPGASADFDAEWDDHVTADGDTFEVRVPAAETAALVAGPYQLIARVVNTAEGITKSWLVNRPLVHADPATLTGAKSHNRTMRDLLRTALQSGATQAQYVSVQVNGRTVEYARADADAQLARYEYLVALEENPNGAITHAYEFSRG